MPNARNPTELAALLDASYGLVELVAGDVRMTVHRAVLEDRSPGMAALLRAAPAGDGGGHRLALQDVEGVVLPKLVGYLYTLRLSRLQGMGAQLLAVADRYGVVGLRSACEQQLGGRG